MKPAVALIEAMQLSFLISVTLRRRWVWKNLFTLHLFDSRFSMWGLRAPCNITCLLHTNFLWSRTGCQREVQGPRGTLQRSEKKRSLLSHSLSCLSYFGSLTSSLTSYMFFFFSSCFHPRPHSSSAPFQSLLIRWAFFFHIRLSQKPMPRSTAGTRGALTSM